MIKNIISKITGVLYCMQNNFHTVARIVLGLAIGLSVVYGLNNYAWYNFCFYLALGIPMVLPITPNVPLSNKARWGCGITACIWCFMVYGILLNMFWHWLAVLLGLAMFGSYVFLFMTTASPPVHNPTPTPKSGPCPVGTVIVKHARVPLVRIPIPWVKYVMTNYSIRRVTWFGKSDPELFKTIENFYFTGNLLSTISGTSSFGFRSKKPHVNDYVVWKYLPTSFAKQLDNTLMSISQPKP